MFHKVRPVFPVMLDSHIRFFGRVLLLLVILYSQRIPWSVKWHWRLSTGYLLCRLDGYCFCSLSGCGANTNSPEDKKVTVIVQGRSQLVSPVYSLRLFIELYSELEVECYHNIENIAEANFAFVV